MDLISILIYLVLIGAVLYIVTLLPIDATIKRVINVVVIVAVLLYLLAAVTGHGPYLIHTR